MVSGGLVWFLLQVPDTSSCLETLRWHLARPRMLGSIATRLVLSSQHSSVWSVQSALHGSWSPGENHLLSVSLSHCFRDTWILCLALMSSLVATEHTSLSLWLKAQIDQCRTWKMNSALPTSFNGYHPSRWQIVTSVLMSVHLLWRSLCL